MQTGKTQSDCEKHLAARVPWFCHGYLQLACNLVVICYVCVFVVSSAFSSLGQILTLINLLAHSCFRIEVFFEHLTLGQGCAEFPVLVWVIFEVL